MSRAFQPSEKRIFLSHASRDAGLAEALRKALDAQGLDVWINARELVGGDPLDLEIQAAIDAASHVVGIFTRQALASERVLAEIAHARDLGKVVVPILMDSVQERSLRDVFGQDVMALPLGSGKGAIQNLLPELLAALGLRAPMRIEPAQDIATAPLADLVLRLSDISIDLQDDEHRAVARGRLIYHPAGGGKEMESADFDVQAPLGLKEVQDLKWYLESYHIWPFGQFRERAERVEKDLEVWGSRLFGVLLQAEGDALATWQSALEDRRFSVLVDMPRGADGDEAGPNARQRLALEGAAAFLRLPWELLRDTRGFLFDGTRAVRVRRCLPGLGDHRPPATQAPIRVLLVSPRPEDEHAKYLDHRASAKPLAEAFRPLGELVELEILDPPTFPAMVEALRVAARAARPFHVVHFDGHGTYDAERGLGGLCFEAPGQEEKIDHRESELVFADVLAERLRDHRVPLVFLEACQSAQAETDPTASVAGRLLVGGVASVVAMSHKVLAESTQRFVEVFYRELMRGRRIGDAMLAGQRALADNPRRDMWKESGGFQINDAFVPVLFQERLDPQLVEQVPAKQVRDVISRGQTLALGEVPKEPTHRFVGRSLELLRAERILGKSRWLVLLGEGGEGKTTLAAELAHWLVLTRRFERAAFVSVEGTVELRAFLVVLGEQLVPGLAGEMGDDLERGTRLVERALAERRTLLLVDNMETLLPPPGDSAAPDGALYDRTLLAGVLGLCARLAEIGETRLVFTSREKMPKPFLRKLRIGRLGEQEAIQLVGQVLDEEGLVPVPGKAEGEEIRRLVAAVYWHARSLVLVAREVAESGVKAAADRVSEIMASLAERYPDDRERSLFASVELSLRRLPEEWRGKVRRLGVFLGGGHLSVMDRVLGLDSEKCEGLELARQLIGVGLAEMLPYGYLRLHPALGPALARELGEAEREEAWGVWVGAMVGLTSFLYQQQFQDARLAATLTLLELSNLLAALEALAARTEEVGAERVVGDATNLEGLLQNLGRPQAQARVARIRERASRGLAEWTHARYLAESAAVDRLLDAGRLAEALAATEGVLRRARDAGEEVYEGAAYDLAMAFARLGRVLWMGRRVEVALAPLGEARERFGKLGEAGNRGAARMAYVCLTEMANALQAGGRLDEAATAYEEAIELAAARKDRRDVATGKFQLGTVRLLQREFDAALAAYVQARQTFEELGEPGSVATAWHQIGLTYQEAGQLEMAEDAYRQSLRLEVQRGDRQGEADSLNQLGNVASRQGHLENAVRFYREAATIAVELGDLAKEGMRRNNIAAQLLALGSHDEARRELERAIECDAPFGHTAEPWTTFIVLHDLELAVGNASAAANARARAVDAFLAYRRQGGENHTAGGPLVVAVEQGIGAGATGEVDAQLETLAGQWPEEAQPLIAALRRIVAGERDAALAEDPALYYRDAVEVRLLLERLGAGE